MEIKKVNLTRKQQTVREVVDELEQGAKGFAIVFNYDTGKMQLINNGACEHCIRSRIDLMITQGWIDGEITVKNYAEEKQKSE